MQLIDLCWMGLLWEYSQRELSPNTCVFPGLNPITTQMGIHFVVSLCLPKDGGGIFSLNNVMFLYLCNGLSILPKHRTREWCLTVKHLLLSYSSVPQQEYKYSAIQLTQPEISFDFMQLRGTTLLSQSAESFSVLHQAAPIKVNGMVV